MTSRKRIGTVLVASRGEIARRVFRACREMGVTSVAVYSDVDAGSVWSRKADLSTPLRGVTPGETYLNMSAILGAAREVGADAIHPGYGFLSENADFAVACEDAGIVFIGPSPEAMRVMGSKVAARAMAVSAGVPVIPGFDGLRGDAGLTGGGAAPGGAPGAGSPTRVDDPRLDDRSAADSTMLAAEAARIGYPILIKADAGGGGRGMRLVREPKAFMAALESARAEASSAFGDNRVFLERYFEAARHIEIQVLGDMHGNLVHLFERECSIQRRHQKIIEESPSPIMTDELRRAMTSAALDLARAVDYRSAGTVEFLLEDDGQFYFLEMNTRLQVEHPITEMVTGVDIVVCQIETAGGEPLPFRQSDIEQQGHALECRVYAEDPANDFLPSTGTIAHYRAPAGPGVRCDDAVSTGSEVSPHYDALLAKVVTVGWDRQEAIRRMSQALSDTVVLGVATNVPYLQDILQHPAFIEGRTHTCFVDRHMSDWSPSAELTEEEWLAVAAYESLFASAAVTAGDDGSDGGRFNDPWSVTEAWRNVP